VEILVGTYAGGRWCIIVHAATTVTIDVLCNLYAAFIYAGYYGNMEIKVQDIKDYLTRYYPDHKIKGVCMDPQVEGTFAARIINKKGFTIDLMWCTAQAPAYGPSPTTVDGLLDDTMEEVEFTAWPPVSGTLKFFH
jgi:hypothetical protein